ncbi:hypothetical protein C8N43_1914 [Litoreibacter ponti]|uniref:LicD family protein n=1 Tax=Litoreibacter ponti TaxID=1510457 RepID=A0A2T6BME1_9RHOB|nr:hypothetical protein [Litoreibacter ponti]PTX57248.1 hypothetical protein C8N43_1914 [Litoreibacter ponti]
MVDMAHYEALYDIRHDGLQALKGAKDLPAETARKHLRRLDRMPHCLKVLDIYSEAVVANSVAGRCRPGRANARLERLRAAGARRGDMRAYEAFEAKVTAKLDGLNMTGHGFTDRSLADADPQAVYQGVRDLISKLAQMGYPAFANSGTLLGLTREGGLLAHDDDIDLAVMLDVTTDAAAARAFTELFEKLQAEGLECSIRNEGNAIIKLPSIDGFEVDLFPAFGTRRRYSIYPYSRRGLRYTDVWPLKPCAATGINLPAKPETLLAANYGKGWRTPNPRFTFPWAARKREFAPFLSKLAPAP